MQGKQLVQMVPIEPGQDPIPRIPRPRGLFDQLCFANSSAFDVPAVEFKLSGTSNPPYTTVLPGVAPGQFQLSTLDVDNGQYHTVELIIQVAGMPGLRLPPHGVFDPAWHVGRVHAGLAGDSRSQTYTPYCVMTLFFDDMTSDQIYVQVVPDPAWVAYP
ncbi:MAG: hypothetical protein ACC662_08870 [Planctomycetota bacterium]